MISTGAEALRFDPRIAERRNRWIRVRMALLCVICLSGAGIVVTRAYNLQVAQSDELDELVRNQYQKTLTLAPMRGSIYDRRGASLAVSIDSESLWANPRLIKRAGRSPAEIAAVLAQLIASDRATLEQRLSQDRYFVWLKRHLTPQQVEAVKRLNIEGLSMTRESKRFYPNRELAAHVMGFANVDGMGIEGLELVYDELLRGKQERVAAVLDRKGTVVYSHTLLEPESMQGSDIVLTLDKTVQHIAEKELRETVTHFQARAGSVMVTDPTTGEILAMANFPTFNPNEPGRYDPAARRNRAVTDRFEPGSTLKPFTMAGAMATGTVRVNERIYCERGIWKIEDYVIHDSEHWGTLSLSEIMARSSNIGIAKIGVRVGRTTLHRMLSRFGFGEATGLQLPGQTQGLLRDFHRWYEVDTATISFGQGLSVSSLQLAMAMGTIANQGRLMSPILIQKVIGPAEKVVFQAQPNVHRQVVPEAVAAEVTRMLVMATGPLGTGKEAALEGFRVAGKTGTAQKANLRSAGYSKDRWVSSFVGFVPANKPRLVVSVVIDEPMVDHAGGTVAGPVFRKVASQALSYLGVLPTTPNSTSDGSFGEAHRRLRSQRQRGAARHARSAHNNLPSPWVLSQTLKKAVDVRANEALKGFYGSDHG